MVFNVSLGRLAQIGGITCVLLTAGEFYMKHKIEENLKSSSYYDNSIQLLQSHKGAMGILGEPIEFGVPSLGDRFTAVGGNEVTVGIPVTGSKSTGTIFLWAKRESGSSWLIERLELGLKDKPDSRLLIHRERS